jgi:hypothetical protein
VAPALSRLAIDLSGSSIRVLEGSIGGQMRCGSAPIPDGALAGGKVVDPAVVGHALRHLAARTEISETRALVAVSDSIATFRVLYLPRTSTEKDIAATVAKELPLDAERIATRWIELTTIGERKVLYAVAWDRAMLKNITDAIKVAGLAALVVELKSAAVARTVTEASCVVVDMSSDTVEVVVVDSHVPQLWHSFDLNRPPADNIAPALATPIRSILRFYSRDRRGDLGPTWPVLISSEQALSAQALAHLAELINQPVRLLTPPTRIPPNVRHSTYLTCLGLIMRRN